MSEEAQEAVTEPVTEAEPDTGQETSETPSFDSPVEAIAADIGWRPDGELSAEDYIRNGQEIQKRQRVSNERLDTELKQTKDMVQRVSRQM
ncbi:MAG: hypothetical protein ACPGVG_14225, partial [Mycobacterium sp.]